MQGKRPKTAKKLADVVNEMYKFIDNQLRFEDFQQPVGMKLHRENRWVQRAESIPWDEVEKRYATLFKNQKGNVAKPLRLALGACIVQAEYGFSDVETALIIQEHPYLQLFCGYKAYDDSKPPFDPSLMVYFRKRLTPEILGEINELIIQKAGQKQAEREESTKDEDDNDEPLPPAVETPKNQGTIIVDATCAPSYIKYPQDTELLNQAREITEQIIDQLHNPADGEKPRTYRRKARRDYLNITRCKKKTAKKIRKAIGKQLGYLRRNLETIDRMLAKEPGKILADRLAKKLDTVKRLYQQQKQMHEQGTHSVENRIISLSQPYLRPIVRGKAKSPVEFGAKLDISVVDGWTRLEYQSFDAYNEAGNLPAMIERYKERTGCYPQRILADKIYRNRSNLAYCAVHHIRLSGPALGRPKKDEIRDKRQDYVDECDRVEVERRFSLAKRKCGLGLIMTRLEETVCHSIALSILVLNLRKVLCAFLRFTSCFFNIFNFFTPFKKMAFVQ